MAQSDLTSSRTLIGGTLLAVGLTACGGPPAPAVGPAPAPSTSASVDVSSGTTGADARGWGKFHSKRFGVTVSLPDGKSWKIDDHRGPSLVATHAATSARLELIATQEPQLMNRQRCEERARNLGWLPNAARLTTLEDEVHVGPEAYDSRVWVALDPGAPSGALEGHVFLFGGFLRRCLLIHYSTSVPSAKDEVQLASRLVVAAERVVKGLSLDPLRTTDDATVPRDRPPSRR